MTVWDGIKSQKRLHVFLALLLVALTLGYFLLWDRSPPFKYLGGNIVPEVAKEGSTVTRSRLTTWYRSDCDVEITGHVIDSDNNRLDTDNFMVPTSPMPDWVAETRAGRPHQFQKDMLVRMPVDKDGNKHYGQLGYFSLDHAWCNLFQRIWPFRLWPIQIDGPMMYFKVEAPG
jgi:hypothetical protein